MSNISYIFCFIIELSKFKKMSDGMWTLLQNLCIDGKKYFLEKKTTAKNVICDLWNWPTSSSQIVENST